VVNVVAVGVAVVGAILAGVGLATSRRTGHGKGLAVTGVALGALAVVIGVIVTVVFAGVWSGAVDDAADEVTGDGSAEVVAPSTADASGGIPVSANGVGVAGAPGVTVEIYVDLMCPACGVFDQVNRDDIAALEQEDGVTVVYHPVSILDHVSQGSAYSTRAANAVGVVADQDPENMPAFVAALLADGTMPDEGTKGLTDAELAEVAQSVGVPRAVTDEFTRSTTKGGRTFAAWVAAGTAALPENSAGVSGTPSIVIDGTVWEGNFAEPGAFRAAVEAAKG
jgi:protein-disulfide isomerase